ncbi:hypothetical protein LXL04_034595 [Taraxacum kok-saghyz]
MTGAARVSDIRRFGGYQIGFLEWKESELLEFTRSTNPDSPMFQFLLKTAQSSDKITVSETINGYGLWKEEPECVQWLQSKEHNSVVYVNFGSLIEMSLQDLEEFGWGPQAVVAAKDVGGPAVERPVLGKGKMTKAPDASQAAYDSRSMMKPTSQEMQN